MKILFASLPLACVLALCWLGVTFDHVLFRDYTAGNIKVQPKIGLLDKLPWLEEVQGAPPLKGIDPDLARLRLGEGAARMVWGVAVLAQTLTFLGCTFYFFAVQYTIMKEKSAKKWMLNIMFVLSVSMSVGVGLYLAVTGIRASASDKTGEYSAYIGSGFLAKAVDAAKINWVSKYIDVSNGLLAAMALAGTLAACLTIHRAAPSSRPATIRDRDRITSGIASLRGLLNASALALIVGVIQVDCEYRWAATLLIDEGKKKLWDAGGSAAASITLATGGFLTLMLAAAFVPAGILLYRRAIGYNEANRPVEGVKPNLDIPIDWKSLIADTFKIVGPALAAGPLAALIGK